MLPFYNFFLIFHHFFVVFDFKHRLADIPLCCHDLLHAQTQWLRGQVLDLIVAPPLLIVFLHIHTNFSYLLMAIILLFLCGQLLISRHLFVILNFSKRIIAVAITALIVVLTLIVVVKSYFISAFRRCSMQLVRFMTKKVLLT